MPTERTVDSNSYPFVIKLNQNSNCLHVEWEIVQQVLVGCSFVEWTVETAEEYEKYMTSEKEICNTKISEFYT